MAVLVEEANAIVMLAGDSSYSQDLLLEVAVDGIGPDASAQRETKQRILRFAAETPTVFVPTHEWAAGRRLVAREPLVVLGASLEPYPEPI